MINQVVNVFLNELIQILLKMELLLTIVFKKAIILIQIQTGTRLDCGFGPKFGPNWKFLLNKNARKPNFCPNPRPCAPLTTSLKAKSQLAWKNGWTQFCGLRAFFSTILSIIFHASTPIQESGTTSAERTDKNC